MGEGDKFQTIPLTCGKIIIHETRREERNEEGEEVIQQIQVIREITEILEANLREEIQTTIVKSNEQVTLGRVSQNVKKFSVGKLYDEQKEALINRI